MYQYKAFISYSHKDERSARRLHRRLEAYNVPKHLIGQSRQSGQIPANLKPIFRDREELAAADTLGDEIEHALASSETLIVICSPRSAKSHWVKKEILSFRRGGPQRKIFSVIIDGEPHASNIAGREHEECFPDALLYEPDENGWLTDTPAEPLAADMREDGDGKRMGFLKLIAGVLGVKLDSLVQREMQRTRRRVTAITVGSFLAVLAFGSLAALAYNSRQQAVSHRAEAEDLIDFMIGDLKDKLEPVGRLDVLDGVADKVLAYYDNYGQKHLDCAASNHKATALLLNSELAAVMRRDEEMLPNTSEAYHITKNNIIRCQDQGSSIYGHAQSNFWMGYTPYMNKDYVKAEEYFTQYHQSSVDLLSLEPDSDKYKKEVISSLIMLAAVNTQQARPEKGIALLVEAYQISTEITVKDGLAIILQAELLTRHARALKKLNRIDESIVKRKEAAAICERFIKSQSSPDWDVLYTYASNFFHIAKIEFNRGKLDEAIAAALKAESEYAKLNIHDPSNSKWREGLARAQYILLNGYDATGEDEKKKSVEAKFERTLAGLASNREDSLKAVQKFVRLNLQTNRSAK